MGIFIYLQDDACKPLPGPLLSPFWHIPFSTGAAVPQAPGGKRPYNIPHPFHPLWLQGRSRPHLCWTGRPNLNTSSSSGPWMGAWGTTRRRALPW